MNENDILGRLISLGTDGPPLAPAHEALRAGRKARTRRRVLGAGGSALSLGVVVALILTLSPSSGGTDTVIAADGGPSGGTGAEVKPGVMGPRNVSELDPDAPANNAAILADVLGPDFKIGKDVSEGALRTGSPSADGLPEGWGAAVRLSAGGATNRALPQYCKAMVEKGTVTDGCVDRELSDGQIVHDNWSRWGSTAEYPQQTAGEQIRVLFRQASGVLVWVDLMASGPAEDVVAAQRKEARKWLESFADKLGAVVTDPDIKPDSFIQADGDPERTTDYDPPTVAKAVKLCADGGERTQYIDYVMSGNGPTDPNTALHQWADTHAKADGTFDPRRFKAYRLETKNPVYAFAHYAKDGAVDLVVEIAKVGKEYAPLAETTCS
jgi:hypothetical protein